MLADLLTPSALGVCARVGPLTQPVLSEEQHCSEDVCWFVSMALSQGHGYRSDTSD